jgi:hypothetical protein
LANETPEASQGRPGQTLKGPVLLEAVRSTIETIEARARIYRWAVICVAASFIVPVLLALALLSWRPLPYLALVVPAVGAFLVIDGRTVLDWQRRILDMWLSRNLTLADLRQTLQAAAHLPAGTVTGMLDGLPTYDPTQRLDQLLPAGRASLLRACTATAYRQDRRTLLSTAGTTLFSCSVATAIASGAVTPLLGAPVGLLLFLASRWLAYFPVRR